MWSLNCFTHPSDDLIQARPENDMKIQEIENALNFSAQNNVLWHHRIMILRFSNHIEGMLK